MFQDAIDTINDKFLKEITDNEVKIVRLQEELEKL